MGVIVESNLQHFYLQGSVGYSYLEAMSFQLFFYEDVLQELEGVTRRLLLFGTPECRHFVIIDLLLLSFFASHFLCGAELLLNLVFHGVFHVFSDG